MIFDNDPERPAKDGNFRSGRSLDPPLRASGSHQLDAGMLASVSDRIANDNPEVRRVVIADLRQESHAFLNDRTVSWCADRDWSNVGHSPAWIARDEQCQLEKLATSPETNIFAVRKGIEGEGYRRRDPGYRYHAIACHTGRDRGDGCLQSQLELSYSRLYVTDHCAPDDDVGCDEPLELDGTPPRAGVRRARRQGRRCSPPRCPPADRLPRA